MNSADQLIDQWLPLRENMPPEGKPLLVLYFNSDWQDMDVLSYTEGYWHRPDNEPKEDNFAPPTHFRLLPELP